MTTTTTTTTTTATKTATKAATRTAPIYPVILRVLAVEATPLVREGLRIAIGQATGLGWLGATASAQAVRASLPRLRPHVVLLDSTLDPRGEFIRDLVAADTALTVVALLGDRQPVVEYLRTAQQAGAHGLVARAATPANLAAAILRAHSTRWFVDPGLARPAPRALPAPTAPVERIEQRVEPTVSVALSGRQRQILDMIADGMSSVTIAEKLVVSPETVRTHIKQLLRRLGAKDRAHAVARAYQLGVLAAPNGLVQRG